MRFLAPELGYLMVEYLSIIRPIEIFFSAHFKLLGHSDLKEFLWADHKRGIWNGDYLSGLLKKYTSTGGLPGLGFQEYRQVATAFMERHLKFKVNEMQNIWDAIYDLQAGHSSHTAGTAYAIASTDHRSISRDALHKYFLASKGWYELLLEIDAKAKGMLIITFNTNYRT